MDPSTTDAELPEPHSLIESLLKRQADGWRTGQPLTIEELVSESESLRETGVSFSKLTKDDRLNLICNEVALREALGQKPILSEYQARFPDLHEELEVQWEIDAMLGVDPWTDRGHPDGGSVGSNVNKLGRYEIRREIGRGAMGIVYEAYDPQLKRTLVLKKLRAGQDADQTEVARIEIEAEAIAQLNHPNIVQLFDVGLDRDVPYLAMEYCEGGTLAQYLNGKALDARQATALMIQIASGVAAAHCVGIVHRDLKPANIMLDNPVSLRPKVSDFGLAKRLGFDSHATATGSLIGSPAYMPPEQAVGASRDIGPAADVYSLGAVLYECLTGRPPFRGTSLIDTLDQVRNCEPVGVRQLEPRVPLDLETIVHKCLRKNAAARYANAQELEADLRRFASYERIHARRENWMETSVRIFRRYPIAASLGMVSIMLLFLITAGSLLVAKRFSSLVRDAELGQAEALVGRAHGIRLSRKPGQRFESLASIRKAATIGQRLGQPASWYEPLRDEAIAAIMLPDAYVETWQEGPQQPLSADFSDDHQQYAVSYASIPDVVVWRMQDHQSIGRIPKPSPKTRVSYVGSHHLLLIGEEATSIELWEVRTPEFTRLWKLEAGCKQYDVSPDKQYVAIADEKSTTVIESKSGTVLSRFATSPFSREPQMAFHPSEPLIIFSTYLLPYLELRDWRTGETIQTIWPGEGSKDAPFYSMAAWTPDGKSLWVLNAHAEANHWYRYDSAARRLIHERTQRPSPTAIGAGPIARIISKGDRALLRGWNSCLELYDTNADRSVFVGPAYAVLGSEHISEKPHMDPLEKIGGFAVQPEHPSKLGFVSIAVGREAKLVVQSSNALDACTSDPTDTFYLKGTSDEWSCMDARTGKYLFRKKLHQVHIHSAVYTTAGYVFTIGQSGGYTWPYRILKDPVERIEFGIPERIHVPFGLVDLASSDLGDVVAFGIANGWGTQEYSGVWVKLPNEPAARKLQGGKAGHACAISRDGQHMVTLMADRSTVWSLEHGLTLRQSLPSGYRPVFDRDAKRVLVGNRVYDTESLQPISPVFSKPTYDLNSDGTQVLSVGSRGEVSLANVGNGKLIANFEWNVPFTTARFAPNSPAILCQTANGKVRVELQRVRDQLAELGLDWEAPPLGGSNSGDWESLEIERVDFPKELADCEDVEEFSEVVDRSALQMADAEEENANWQFAAAMVRIQRHELVRAADLLDRTCKLLPESVTPRMWRAYVAAAMQDYRKAIKDATWVLDRTGDLELQLLRAEWNYRLGDLELAIEDCSRVIEQEGWELKYAYGLRAACYERLGEKDRFELDQKKFVELTRFDGPSLQMIADSRAGPDISLRQPTIALRTIRKFLSLNLEADEQMEATIARTMLRNGLLEEAKMWSEKCLARTNGTYAKEQSFVLAIILQGLGESGEAQRVFARGQALDYPTQFEYRDRRNLRTLEAEARGIVFGTEDRGQSSLPVADRDSPQ